MRERLEEIKKEVNTLPKSWFFHDHAMYLFETIEKQQQAIEQSLRHFDNGERLDGLWTLKQALEGNTPLTEQQAIADLIYLELKEAPLTIGELSQRLNIELGKVSHTINHMIDKYPICQKDEKYYVPKFCPLAWIGAFVTICIVTLSVLEVL